MYRGRRVIILGAILLLFLWLAPIVGAQYGYGYGQYGSGAAPAILIDKMVGRISTEKGGTTSVDYVDNLSPSDPRFNPQDEVAFKLKVKNTSDTRIEDVIVTDTLPEFVSLVEAKGGSYNAENRTVTIKAGDFKAQEEKEFTLRVKLAPQDKLPTDRSILCLINKSRAASTTTSDEDTAQFCVEKTVEGVSAQPSTGPADGPILTTLYVLALGLGLALSKYRK